MTFFFGPVYFQYHLFDKKWQKGRIRTGDGVLGLSQPNS